MCIEHQVGELYAFGSSTRDSFRDTSSDIDLLVEIDEVDPLLKGQLLLDLWEALELFFGRKVDLLTPTSLQNPYLKKEIDATKVKIYDGQRQEIFS